MANTIHYPSGAGTVDAELYSPARGTPIKGAVVIAYGSDGLVDNEHGNWETMIRGYAQDLAQAGTFAIIPRYLEATTTTPGLGIFAFLPTLGGTWESAIVDAVTHARTLVPTGAKTGLLGFSFGGYLCLRARRVANALSSYFAPELDAFATGAASRVLTHAEIHHGEADAVVEFSNSKKILAALVHEGVSTELHPDPGAGHGFVGPLPANVDARTKSKKKTLAFFAMHLA